MTLYPLQVEPAKQLPDMPVGLPGKLRVGEDGLVAGEHRFMVVAEGDESGSNKFARRLPAEFYLRQLLDLDLKSDQELVGFMEEFGLLGSDTPEHRPQELRESPVTRIASARERAAVLRDTTRTLLTNEGLLDENSLFALWESRRGDPSSRVVFQPNPLEACVKLASGVITAGLSPFGPRVVTMGLVNGLTVREVFGVSLESAICAQMFNHLAEAATFRRCAFSPCSKAFVRQSGRATQGQHKLKGVEYCSKECARAAASKAYRDRRRAARAITETEESGR